MSASRTKITLLHHYKKSQREISQNNLFKENIKLQQKLDDSEIKTFVLTVITALSIVFAIACLFWALSLRDTLLLERHTEHINEDVVIHEQSDR